MVLPLPSQASASDAVPSTLVDPFGDTALDNPAAVYPHLRELGPAVWLERYDLWAVARFSTAEQVLTQPDVWTSADGVGVAPGMAALMGPGEVILHSAPPRHTVLREILLGQLGRAGLRRWQPRVMAIADGLVAAAVDSCAAGSSVVVDVVPLARQFAVSVAADIAGLPAEGRAMLSEYSREAFTAFGPDTGQHACARATAMASLDAMVTYLTGAVGSGRLVEHSAGADILAAARQQRIDAATAVQLLAALVVAGVDTVAAAVTNLIRLVGAHPTVWQKLRAGTVTVADTVTEALRLESPIRAFTRTATTDTVLGEAPGPQIAVLAGERVLVCYAEANRDPARWPAPDRFDPGRPPRPHLAYGRGLHACIGQGLATLELHAMTRALLAGVEELAVVSHLAHSSRHPVINTYSRLDVALRPLARA